MKPPMRLAGAAMVFAVAISGLGASPASAEPDFGLDDDYSWSPIETSTNYFTDAFDDLSSGNGLALDTDYNFDSDYDFGDDFNFDTDYDFGTALDGESFDLSSIDALSSDSMSDSMDDLYAEAKDVQQSGGSKDLDILGTKVTINPPQTSESKVRFGSHVPSFCVLEIVVHTTDKALIGALKKMANNVGNTGFKYYRAAVGVKLEVCDPSAAAADSSKKAEPNIEASKVSNVHAFGLIMMGVAYAVTTQTVLQQLRATVVKVMGIGGIGHWADEVFKAFADCAMGFIGVWGTATWPNGGWGVAKTTDRVARSLATCFAAGLGSIVSGGFKYNDVETHIKIQNAVKTGFATAFAKARGAWPSVRGAISVAWQQASTWLGGRSSSMLDTMKGWWNNNWAVTIAAGVAAWQAFKARLPWDVNAMNYSEDLNADSFNIESLDLDSFDLGSFDTNYSEDLNTDSFNTESFDLGSFDLDDDYSFLGDFGGTNEGSYLDFGLNDLDLAGALG